MMHHGTHINVTCLVEVPRMTKIRKNGFFFFYFFKSKLDCPEGTLFLTSVEV